MDDTKRVYVEMERIDKGKIFAEFDHYTMPWSSFGTVIESLLESTTSADVRFTVKLLTDSEFTAVCDGEE